MICSLAVSPIVSIYADGALVEMWVFHCLHCPPHPDRRPYPMVCRSLVCDACMVSEDCVLLMIFLLQNYVP